ncbi:MAG: fused ferrous iron transport protein A/B, partial [Agathobacter sp.]|nr:fused ferrous iron transport protein A/B [Agathobacter sp.]
MNLAEIKEGESAILTEIGGAGALRQHFLDMGLIPGTRVTYVKAAPMGDPIEYRIWDYELTLRLSEAEQIQIADVQTLADEGEKQQNTAKKKSSGSKHPGLGEMGIYHVKQRGEKIGKDELLTFGLAGNQNCGKTTLFNQLTGSNQHVGNFPGVTVDRKDGPIRNQEHTLVTDLPGIYSMSPYTSEEIVSREFFLNDRPRGIINIVDATNIERNLYLTLQLIELDIPMVLALNMMDEVRENGGTIDINLLEDTLGIPVVPISAAKNEGIDELVEHAVHVARYRERPGRMDFCDAEGQDGGAMHRCIHSIMHLIEDHAHKYKIPTRFAASKLVEGDKLVEEALHLDQNEREMIEHIISQMETESGMDRQAALANMRFTFIHKVCDATVVRPHESKEHIRSQKMDHILTGKYTAIPVFAAIMILIFYLTFGLIGKWLSDFLNLGIDAFTGWVDSLLTLAHVNEVVHSLVIDGIFTGVGSVLGFLPMIVTLFFFLSLLEDSGY